VQRERFENPENYEKVKGVYVINRAMIEKAKKGITILYSLPRIDKIATDVGDYEGVAYFR